MSTQPLFSILIANYNNGRYLKEAVKSVIAQSYDNWEIVIVDDGSTDNSVDVYDELKGDSRIRIYFNEIHHGCGYTKHRCAAMAEGELCAFLDADDVLLPNALAQHAAVHETKHDISCVMSRFYFCKENMEIIAPSRLLVIKEGEDYFTTHDYCPEHLVSYKSVYYKKTSGIDSTLPAGVDQDLYFRLEEVAPVYVLDAITYKYRLHESTISSNKNFNFALYWNLYVRHQTCIRRGLDPNVYPCKDFTSYIKIKDDEIKIKDDEIERLHGTKSFRLGKALLRPFNWINNTLRNHRTGN